MDISVVIPVARKNLKVLSLNLEYIEKYICPRKIYILTSQKNFCELLQIQNNNIVLIDEDTLYPNLTYSTIKSLLKRYNIGDEHTGWYFQQFLKMAWSRSEYIENDYFMTWDADTFPLREIQFFSQNKPLIARKTEHNEAYFQTIKTILNIDKIVQHSFISEKMIFSKKILDEMLSEIENTGIEGTAFFEKIIYAVSLSDNPSKGFSEFETYGTYLTHYYPDSFSYMDLLSIRNGAKYTGTYPSKYVLKYFSRKYDIASFENWTKQRKFFIFCFKLYCFILSGLKII